MIETRKTEDKRWASRLTDESKAIQKRYGRFWTKNKRVPSLAKYNLTICDRPKFIWFRNAKVATRTILEVLGDVGIELTVEHASRCHYSPQHYKDYFKFAFVRNPWDRFVSGWLNKVVKMNHFEFSETEYAKMQQFDRFIAHVSTQDLAIIDTHFRPQYRLIDINEVDFIGRLESFEKDFKEILNLLGFSVTEFPFVNKSERDNDYRKYYTEETRRIVGEMYKKDIQLFRYTF